MKSVKNGLANIRQLYKMTNESLIGATPTTITIYWSYTDTYANRCDPYHHMSLKRERAGLRIIEEHSRYRIRHWWSSRPIQRSGFSMMILTTPLRSKRGEDEAEAHSAFLCFARERGRRPEKKEGKTGKEGARDWGGLGFHIFKPFNRFCGLS